MLLKLAFDVYFLYCTQDYLVHLESYIFFSPLTFVPPIQSTINSLASCGNFQIKIGIKVI